MSSGLHSFPEALRGEFVSLLSPAFRGCPHSLAHVPVSPFSFFFGCVGSSLLQAGFPYLRQVGATLRYGARASHCGGFSCCGARALGVWASVVVASGLSSCGSRALERRLSSCGPWA